MVMMKTTKKIRSITLKTLLLAAFFTMFAASFVSAAESARPSVNGRLCVKGAQLSDQRGRAVVLNGISTHGLTWYPDFVNRDRFEQLSLEWNCNLIRLAAYSDQYVDGKSKETLELVRKGIDAAIASDMYVLVDWHVLTEHDPNVYIDEAGDFFRTISSEYPDSPNIIYEICNEPNGETEWAEVKSYAETIIPIIRANSPDSVILVGTPEYDRNLTSAARSPLDFENIMYVLHFYAATHKNDLRSELIENHRNGLPIFISECGICEASGDGKIDFESAAEWFKLLNEEELSYTVWSFSNKAESSAMTRPSYDPKNVLTDDDITASGLWVRSLIQGEDPSSIPMTDLTTNEGGIRSFFANSLTAEELVTAQSWPKIAAGVVVFIVIAQLVGVLCGIATRKRNRTYDDLAGDGRLGAGMIIRRLTLLVSTFFTMLYLIWRILWSIPKGAGYLPIVGNVLLLIVEILGFIESLILYMNLMRMKDHPLPHIEDDEYPDVDIFIATYNEPEELLRKTINGCNHLIYPDKSKVHIWVCDDNRRASMRALADEMGVGYFDRPDNEGAKAGNLNNALAHTRSPYVLTLDADMIPMSHFLMKTIPYFVDAKKRSGSMPEGSGLRLGLLQTPQCFYQPDVFQHTLYSDNTAPNEQDFFYRTIEVSKTGTNSVIYGGSNTILSREALDAVGGFYTKTITEDFATGMLLESNGFVSLALSEPMASGMVPDTYREHIQQRTRWGRGVIGTAKQLHILRRRGLSVAQKLSYLSSVVYWFSPIKNLIYILSPLLYATFAIPVFKCSWLDLVLFWMPMFIMQDVCLRVFSKNAVSLKWSGIYETSVMPHLLIPIIRETFGMTALKFEVTDKSGKYRKNKASLRIRMPFYILIAMSVIGTIRSIYVFSFTHALGIFILLFWLIRNLYFLIMSLFIIDGRDSDIEPVKVIDAESVSIAGIYGITTCLTEHNVKAFLDEAENVKIGDSIDICIEKGSYKADVKGIITNITVPRSGDISRVVTAEITDMADCEYEYLQILYDRIPTLPQSLRRDLGIIRHLLINIAHRVLQK